jgi:hypothetical protein
LVIERETIKKLKKSGSLRKKMVDDSSLLKFDNNAGFQRGKRKHKVGK